MHNDHKGHNHSHDHESDDDKASHSDFQAKSKAVGGEELDK